MNTYLYVFNPAFSSFGLGTIYCSYARSTYACIKIVVFWKNYTEIPILIYPYKILNVIEYQIMKTLKFRMFLRNDFIFIITVIHSITPSTILGGIE